MWKGMALLCLGVIGVGAGCCENRDAGPALDGSIVCVRLGSSVDRIQLDNWASTRLMEGWSTSRGSGGVGGIYRDVAIVGMQDKGYGAGVGIYEVPLGGGAARRLSTGDVPRVTADGKWIVFCGLGREGRDDVPLFRMAVGGGGADSFGVVRDMRTEVGWLGGYAAVALDSDCVAVVGPEGGVWRYKVGSGQRARVGGAGLVPEFWEGTTGQLVCARAGERRNHVALNIRTGETRELPALYGAVGYASSRRGGLTLFVRPGRPRPGRDSWQLMVYEWSSGKSYVVRPDFYFAENGIWTE